jgi:hypothetical protein
MPWRCPACQIQIHHSDVEPKPRVSALYRCHICRMELTLDPKTDKLRVAPMPPGDAERGSARPRRPTKLKK